MPKMARRGKTADANKFMKTNEWDTTNVSPKEGEMTNQISPLYPI